MSAPALYMAVQTAPFDLGEELQALHARDPGIGAVVGFIGYVRDQHAGGAVEALELEHYPGMTEKALEAIALEAVRRFGIRGARLIHRVGYLQPADPIVLVAASAEHRAAAFDACAFMMDYLKTQAPFWKKEHTPQGAHWVEAREQDAQAVQRWQPAS